MVSGEKLLADIADAMRAGDSARAAGLADIALAQGIVHALPYQARALHLDRSGRGEEALADFRTASDLNPRDPMAANGVALCLGRMGRLDEAMDAFRAALFLDPGLATTYFHMGWILERNERFAAACDAYGNAVRLAPGYAAAWAGLATASQAHQHWKQAQSAAMRALAIDPRQPRVILALAIAETQQGMFAGAEAHLRSALAGHVPRELGTVMRGVLADALDGQDKTAEAFAFYTAENNERRAGLPAPPQPDMAALVQQLTAYFAHSDIGGWRAAEDKCDARAHIFLLGFPRSGTTLLEQVLAVHPDVATLEESDVLDPAAEEFLRDVPGLERFAALDAARIAELRDGYWKRVQAQGLDVRGKLFVDKLPLNTIKLPLIAKLFPGAKVIFALRDPRDVVFSCFRRHFQVNASTYPFLTLEGTAGFYDLVMTLGEMCRERLPLRFHLHRHEDLIGDFEGQMRGLCAFAGLGWTGQFGAFAQAARQRSIRSISAAQVRQGLNGEGLGQWRRYAKELAPILPILQPWVERFGYARA